MGEDKYLCRYCNSDKSKTLYNTFDIFGYHYEIKKCKECNAYFLSPRPDDIILSLAYDSSYYGEKEEKFDGPIEKVLDKFRLKRAKRVSSFLQPDANVLDIGCGNGRFLQSLLNFGKFNLYGIEMEGNSAKRAARIKEINLKVGTLEYNDYPDNFFDAVTLFHVFEHLANPKETLKNITSIIKPGGILVMSFPNIGSWQSKFYKGKWLHLDPPRHLFFFKNKDIIRIMNEMGFEKIDERYFSMEQNPFGEVQSLLNLFYKKREVLFESLKGNVNYTKRYSKSNILFQKLFFVCSFPFFIITDAISSMFKGGATMEFIFRKKFFNDET